MHGALLMLADVFGGIGEARGWRDGDYEASAKGSAKLRHPYFRTIPLVLVRNVRADTLVWGIRILRENHIAESRGVMVAALFAGMFLFLSTVVVYAQTIDAKGMKAIQEVVQEICQAPNKRGEYLRVEGEGKGSVSIGILRPLGAAGISADANFSKEEWDGVRKVLDQNAENANYRDCVTRLTPLFLDKFGKDAKKSESHTANSIADGSVKILGRSVKYTRWLDGTQSCFNGTQCATAVLILENSSKIGFKAAIKSGSTTVGACVGNETEAGSLKVYDNHPGWTNNVPLHAALRLIPPASRIPLTIKLENCAPTSARSVDISVVLTVQSDDGALDIPLSALDVPVRQ